MGVANILDHIAVAVKDLEGSLAQWTRSLGLKPGEIEEVAGQKVRLCKLQISHGPAIELISPIELDSPVARFIKKRGEGIHHFCFEVPDIEEALEVFKNNGARLIHEKPVLGAEGSRVAFIHPQSFNGVLIELKQKTSSVAEVPAPSE